MILQVKNKLLVRKHFWIETDMVKKISDAAEKQGMKPGPYVRMILREHVKIKTGPRKKSKTHSGKLA